jgi:hypothetical protein
MPSPLHRHGIKARMRRDNLVKALGQQHSDAGICQKHAADLPGSYQPLACFSPTDAQDDIARVVLRLTGADDEPPVPLTPEEQAAITASKAAAARGEFATDEQVRAVWAKHGL